jgi:hypothetical protein
MMMVLSLLLIRVFFCLVKGGVGRWEAGSKRGPEREGGIEREALALASHA